MILENTENVVPNMFPRECYPTFYFDTFNNFNVVRDGLYGFLKNHLKFILHDLGKHRKFCGYFARRILFNLYLHQIHEFWGTNKNNWHFGFFVKSS